MGLHVTGAMVEGDLEYLSWVYLNTQQDAQLEYASWLLSEKRLSVRADIKQVLAKYGVREKKHASQNIALLFIAHQINALPHTGWCELSDESRDWYIAAAEVINRDVHPILPPFPS
jgi:hypothetical protein